MYYFELIRLIFVFLITSLVKIKKKNCAYIKLNLIGFSFNNILRLIY